MSGNAPALVTEISNQIVPMMTVRDVPDITDFGTWRYIMMSGTTAIGIINDCA
jgi:hypothetical protein